EVTTDLATAAGRLALVARLNAREPGAFYRVRGDLGDFVLSRLFTRLPDPTVLTGRLELEGRGTDPRTAAGEVAFDARSARVGELDVDTARVRLRVADGSFHVDEVEALVSGVELRAAGTLAAHEEGPRGEVR